MGSEDLKFNSSGRPTLGVELELQLIDADSLELKSAVLDLLGELPADQTWAKPELMQSYIEINTGVCKTVGEVASDLRTRIRTLEQAAQRHNTKLFWAATHPFSSWMDQEITPNERYKMLVEKMQDVARRIVTFGMHVHVGVESGDKAVMLVDRMMRYLPSLLALSANSPFWVNRRTGLHSHRCKIMDQLPAAGLPPVMRNYSEYCWVVNHSIQTGFINSIREIWWDIRPHPRFGTVEIRICDQPPALEDVIALTALIQCLVCALSDRINEGVYQHDIHPIMVGQNKWKAARYGMKAEFIDPVTHKTIPARDMVFFVYELVKPYADRLECRTELDQVLAMLNRSTGAERQLSLYETTGDLREVVRRLAARDPLSPFETC